MLWDDAGLLGGRDPASGRVAFPRPDGWDAAALGRTGTLWSWTVQRFAPKSPPYAGPEPFAPFAVGYVELDEVIVEARLDGVTFDTLRIGMPLKLAVVPFGGGETFVFRPSA